VSDPVNPEHYKGTAAADLIDLFNLNFNRGQVIKYVCRADGKGATLTDLKKALWYLNREVNRLEKTPGTQLPFR